MARCTNCGKQFASNLRACPYCKTPSTSEEAKDTVHVMNALKEIYTTFGVETIRDKQRFVSILRDYIPEYDKERRLLTSAIENGIVDALSKEVADQESAIVKAREFMEREMFLSSNAIDFILESVTYMLGWDYAVAPVQDDVEIIEEKLEEEKPKESRSKGDEKEQAKGAEKETKIFTASDAMKYRIKGVVEIPSGYTAIKGFAFDEFSFLKSITIPEGVVAIGEYAFSNCSKLSTVNLPNSLRFIKASAFESCTKLTSIDIPNGVISIEEGTFQFCENLQSITIPETVGSIGASAFSCCENLGMIHIPDSVKYIGEDVFNYCSNVIVECVEYSYVHKYCQANGITFKLIG
jgi:RNA polymerase subunit RPABC4/transcription elongation factor Spt4